MTLGAFVVFPCGAQALFGEGAKPSKDAILAFILGFLALIAFSLITLGSLVLFTIIYFRQMINGVFDNVS